MQIPHCVKIPRRRISRGEVERTRRALLRRGARVIRGALTLRMIIANPVEVQEEEIDLTIDALDLVWRRFGCGPWRMRVVLGWDTMPAVLAASEMAADEPGFITAGLYSSAWTGRRMPALVLDCGRVARVGVWHDRALSLVETVAHEAMHAVQHAMAKADGDLWPPIEARLYGERGNVSYDDEGDLLLAFRRRLLCDGAR
jgi:hypothetical protein